MGIPGLFSFIKKNFQECITSVNNEKFTTNHLFIDSNCLIHESAQIAFNYGPSARCFVQAFKDKELTLFEKYFEKIVTVYNMIKPSKTLYIAIDGVAPVAKQLQQRQRRFISSLSSRDFDSNCITPGTKFMYRLYKFLKKKIISSLEVGVFDVTVYLSGPNVPGEGEHKIIDFIRTNKPTKDICIFGPDGDLIMLCLALNTKRVSLCRRDFSNTCSYNIINIDSLSLQLAERMGNERPMNDLMNDFIVLGFMLGNDFLPKIKMIYRIESGINLLLKLYRNCHLCLTIDGELNIPGFKRFIKHLKDREYDKINKQLSSSLNSSESKFRDVTLIKSAVNTLDLCEYSKNLFNCSINDVCESYIQTLIWNVCYYTKGLSNWETAYKYHYAPLMKDFYSYLNEDYKLNKTNSEIPSPFLQLMMVLPSQSCNLVPKEYRNLLLEGELVTMGLYPKSFVIDFQGKTEDYQGVALLPFVDINIVKRVCLCNSDNKRNKVKETLCIKID